MRKIKIGSKELGLKATLSVLFPYRDIFETELIDDILQVQQMMDSIASGNFKKINTKKLLRVIWAMNMNYEGIELKNESQFNCWMEKLEDEQLNLSDPNFWMPIVNEGMDGYFVKKDKSEGEPKKK
ncbi:MAG: hypothetical protein K9L56_15685 [Clostridiales bacterium]|nr:hypothetical protein [Clostridiales bacterium]